MRDYGNMPVLTWAGTTTAKKAMAQVHHAEPVILVMPADFAMTLDAAACGCTGTDDPHHFLGCRAADALKALAEANRMPELAQLAAVAHEARQVVDIETDTRRIIIRD